MRLSLYSKSNSDINSDKKLREYLGRSKIELNASNRSTPKSQSDNCLRTYFKMFPQHKTKRNVSVLDFFANKLPRKTRQNQADAGKQPGWPRQPSQPKINFEGNFIIKRRKSPSASLGTQKLFFFPKNSDQKLQKSIQSTQNVQQQQCNNQNKEDKAVNKIDDILKKNTKFDRKKYMYYRYRKRTSPQKYNDKLQDGIENDHSPSSSYPQKVIQAFNSIRDIQLQDLQRIENLKNSPEKRNVYGTKTAKFNSFLQKKCKLVIQPTPRKSSYTLIDRKGLCITTRQHVRHKVQLFKNQKNGTKIFTQAMHFKQRKKNKYQQPQVQMPCKKYLNQNNGQNLLGWDQILLPHLQEEYFF